MSLPGSDMLTDFVAGAAAGAAVHGGRPSQPGGGATQEEGTDGLFAYVEERSQVRGRSCLDLHEEVAGVLCDLRPAGLSLQRGHAGLLVERPETVAA